MNDSSMSNPAGQPSMITPIDLPCDSPKVDILNSLPNVFPTNSFLKVANITRNQGVDKLLFDKNIGGGN